MQGGGSHRNETYTKLRWIGGLVLEEVEFVSFGNGLAMSKSVDDVRRRPSTSGDESENVRALRGTPNPMVGGAAESKKSYMLAIVADHVHFVDSVFLSFASLWFLRTHAARR